MSLAEFARDLQNDTATVTVLNRESDDSLYRVLDSLFNEDAITVREITTDRSDSSLTDTVIVERTGDEDGFAISSLDELSQRVLLVNSDIYVTGSRSLDEVKTPDVITELDEIPFTVKGYPRDPKEKLLLIEISRYIEAMAWQTGEGCLHTGFQYLSRIDDEKGTRRVYERLSRETTVETHVYGMPDSSLSLPGIHTHTEACQELRQSWFVVYQSTHHPHEAAALVAVEKAPHTWEGCWTYNAEKVKTILNYLDQRY